MDIYLLYLGLYVQGGYIFLIFRIMSTGWIYISVNTNSKYKEGGFTDSDAVDYFHDE